MRLDGRKEALLRAYSEGRSLPPVDGPPPPEPNPKPWYRRAWAWIVEGHKAVIVFAGICTTTIAVHAWLAGLVTKANVDETVQSAVAKALLETNSRVKDLETDTRGLPAWRGETTKQDAVRDTRIQELDRRTTSVENRLEATRIRR